MRWTTATFIRERVAEELLAFHCRPTELLTVTLREAAPISLLTDRSIGRSLEMPSLQQQDRLQLDVSGIPSERTGSRWNRPVAGTGPGPGSALTAPAIPCCEPISPCWTFSVPPIDLAHSSHRCSFADDLASRMANQRDAPAYAGKERRTGEGGDGAGVHGPACFPGGTRQRPPSSCWKAMPWPIAEEASGAR